MRVSVTPIFLIGSATIARSATLATYRPTDFTLAGADVPEHVQGERISAEFFDALGVRLRLGRSFRLDEDRPGATPVALVSEGLWRHRYGAQAAILSQSVVDGVAYTIVGVVPANFHFSGKEFVAGDVYIPIGQSNDWALWRRQFTYNYGIGRLRPGVTPQRAREDRSFPIR